MSAMRFGEYLAQLLGERECSGSRIANLIGIDPALVYRWLRNEAVPKLDTSYCNDIARYLHLTQAELSRLKEAQIYSLSRPPDRRIKARNGGAAVERLLRQAGPQDVPAARATAPLLSLPNRLPRQSGVIWGRPAILETVISLLENLPALTRLQSNSVMLSFQGEEDAFDDFPDLQALYEKTLQGVLQRGWQVCHLWRLDRDAHRSILLVEDMLKFLGTGRYFPYYLSQYGTLAPPYDLLIVPQTAAMLFFATQNPWRTDAALLTRDPEQIELLRTHFYQLRAQSQPLAQSYLPQDEANILEAYAEAESQPGGRMVVKDGLSFLTEPPSWYQEGSPWTQGTGLTGSALTSFLEQQQRRLAAFQRNVRSYLYREICPMGAVEQMVSAGQPPRDDQEMRFLPSRQARRDQLLNTIELLRTYEKYQLALVNTAEAARIPTATTWEVVEENSVFLLVWRPDETGKEIMIDVRIKEPTIIRAFQSYFEDHWERIAPQNRDKDSVISWLEQQAALIE